MLVCSDVSGNWEITSPCVSPWAEQICSQDTCQNVEDSSIHCIPTVGGIHLLEQVLESFFKCLLRVPLRSRKVLSSCRFSRSTVLGCHRASEVALGSGALSNKGTWLQSSWAAFPASLFLQLMDLCLLHLVLTPALLTPAYRNILLCCDTRQTH